MSKIGEITLKAAKDFSRGEKVTLDSLFSENEQKKEFETLAQVAPEETIRVKVSKLGDLETKAWCFPPVTLTPKSKTALQWITHDYFRKEEVNVSEDIKKEEGLTVVFETA